MPSSRYTRYLLKMALGFGLTGVLLPGYVELFPMNLFPKGYAAWAAQFDFADRPAHPEPDVLVLGDSRGHAAALPELLAPHARSLALSGATPIEVYYLFRRYLDHHPAPRLVYVSFAPNHLWLADAFWESAIKFKALRRHEAFEVFRRAEELADDMLGSADEQQLARRWLSYRFNLANVYAAELQNSKLVLRRDENLELRRRIDGDAGHTYYGSAHASRSLNKETEPTSFETSPLLDAYLDDLLELAADHDVRAVVATLPINQSSYDRLDPGFVRSYEAYMARLGERHPEALVLGEIWRLPDDFFGDESSHVNPRGAPLVSEWLASHGG